VRAFVGSHLSRHGKSLGKAAMRALVAARQTRQPVFLSLLLTELLAWSNFQTLDERLKLCLSASSVEELCDHAFARIEQGYGQQSVAAALGFLCACPSALKESELLQLLGTQQSDWYPLYYALKPYLFESAGALRLLNPQFKAAAARRYARPHSLKGNRSRLAQMFLRQNNSRSFAAAAQLLTQASRYAALHRLLTRPAVFALLWRDYRYLLLECAHALTAAGFAQLGKELAERIAHKARPDKSTFLYVADFCVRSGDLQTAQALYSRLLQLSPDDYRFKAAALGGLGNIALQTADLRDAERFFKSRRQASKEAADQLELAKSTASLGQVAFAQRNLPQAIRSFNQARAVFCRYAYRNGEQAALGNLGNAYYQLGEPEKAARMFARQERLCRETGNRSALLSALDGHFLACLLKTGDDFKADSTDRHAQGRTPGRTRGHAQDHTRGRSPGDTQDHTQDYTQNYAQAARILATQKELCEQMGLPEKLMNVLCNQAVLEYRNNNGANTLALLQQAYALACQLNHFDGQNTLLMNLADYHFEAGALDQAITLAKERVALCRKNKRLQQLCNALFRLSYFLREQGNKQEGRLVQYEAQQIVAYHGIEPAALTDDILLVQKGESRL
jgi:tetratricopeptide (TPR) repeat protein